MERVPGDDEEVESTEEENEDDVNEGKEAEEAEGVVHPEDTQQQG